MVKKPIPKKNASELVKSAIKNKSIIIACGVNQQSLPYLHAEFPTKPFEIKAKTQSGVDCCAPGLIEEHQLSETELQFIRHHEDYAIDDLVLSTTEILSAYPEAFLCPSDRRKGEVPVIIGGNVTFSPAGFGDFVVCDESHVALRVLTKDRPVTSDVDLWGVLPSWESYHQSTDAPVHVTVDNNTNNGNIQFLWALDENTKESSIGNVSTLVRDVISDLQSIAMSQHKEVSVHHNAAQFNPYSDNENDYPLTAVVPTMDLTIPFFNTRVIQSESGVNIARVFILENSDELDVFLDAVRDEYVFMPNPNWQSMMPIRGRLMPLQIQVISAMLEHKRMLLPVDNRNEHTTPCPSLPVIAWHMLSMQQKNSIKPTVLARHIMDARFSSLLLYWLFPLALVLSRSSKHSLLQHTQARMIIFAEDFAQFDLTVRRYSTAVYGLYCVSRTLLEQRSVRVVPVDEDPQVSDEAIVSFELG